MEIKGRNGLEKEREPGVKMQEDWALRGSNGQWRSSQWQERLLIAIVFIVHGTPQAERTTSWFI